MLRTIAGIPWRQWVRPPGHLLVLFLLTSLSFLAALFYLGWRSVQQAEVVEAQRVHEALESATDLVVTELRRNLSDVEGQLDRFSAMPAANLTEAMAGYGLRLGGDGLVVAFDATAVYAFPPGRLLYYPMLPGADEPILLPLGSARLGGSGASGGETELEHFRVLTQAEDERVRAQGLLGLARTQAKLGEKGAAAATYQFLHRPDLLVEGRPAELLARVARCGLLADMARPEEFAAEVQALSRDLHSGRWQLTRAAYQHYATEVRALADKAGMRGRELRPEPTALALASAVDFLWKLWQEQGLTAEMAAGRTTRVWQGEPVFLMWRATTDRFVTLVAGPRFVQDRVVDPLRGMLDRQGVRVVLADAEGQVILPRGSAPLNMQRGAVRIIAETKLPWMLGVATARSDTDQAQFQTRRRLVIAGSAVLTLFVLAAGYFGVRATAREFEAVRLKSDFVAAVSHEFRTPLTLLRQFSDLLAEDRVANDHERRLYYAALQRGTRRLTRLVEDLLDFGRIEAGSRAFKLDRVVAKDWLESLTREFQEEIGSKGYHVELSWSGAPGAILRADVEAISRALWNLLDNAVKYSPECKTIWVRGEFVHDLVRVSVRDRGVGIPANEQRLIFRKFVRGSVLGGQAVKGTGLGLALVEQILHAHRGSVHVESVVGEGSTFSVALPASVDADDAEDAGRVKPEARSA